MMKIVLPQQISVRFLGILNNRLRTAGLYPHQYLYGQFSTFYYLVDVQLCFIVALTFTFLTTENLASFYMFIATWISCLRGPAF